MANAEINIAGTHGTKVAGYLRKSSSGKKKQEASIGDQKAAITAYCNARGWVVVQWFTDNGKSASKNQHLRIAFQAMLREATESPEWSGVVTWQFDRFNRGNSLDSVAANTLHGAGIWLESTQEGRANWDTEFGRLHWAMTSESNHAYSVKLSAATTRGRSSALAEGYWVHGRVPYAYDRQYVRSGLEPIVLDRNAEAGRPGGYRLKLLVNDAEAKVVVWIFGQVLAGKPLRWIASKLNEQGHPTPYESKHGWQWVTVRQVIQTPAYVGDLKSAYSHAAKYNAGKWNRIADQVKVNAVPAIVDRETWATANKILSEKKELGKQTKRGPRRNSGLLSGIAKCGHCGFALKKAERRQRVCCSCGCDVPRVTNDGSCLCCGNDAGNEFRQATYYYCATSSYYPNVAGKCRCHVVHEDRILPLVRDKLLARIEAQVLRDVLAKPVDKPNADLEAMRIKVRGLRGQVTAGAKRLMAVPDDLIDLASAQLRELKDELEATEAQIRLAENTTSDVGRRQVTAWLEELKGEWIRLAEAVAYNPIDHRRTYVYQELTADQAAKAKRMMRATGRSVVQLDGLTVMTPDDDSEDRQLRATRYTNDKLPPLVLKPGLTAHRDALRGLLEKLSVSVAIHWRPTSPNDPKSAETPDFARISAKFEVPAGIDTSDHLLVASNGR